jgi:hypothetical protein
VAKEGTVFKPTMEGSEKDKRRQSQGSSVDHAVVANLPCLHRSRIS